MSSEVLLSGTHDPLKRLTMERVRLSEPTASRHLIDSGGNEVAIYPLTGAVEVGGWGVLGARQSIVEPPPGVFRMPAGESVSVTLNLRSDSADMLVIRALPGALSRPYAPMLQNRGIYRRQVGAGCHQRVVYEFDRAHAAFEINLGETLNQAGGWSSYPAHATPEVASTRYEMHEEIMFFIGPRGGYCVTDGYFSNGEHSSGMTRIENGAAHVMPLGYHAIVADPGAWLWYAWFYVGGAITKQYNRWATDLGTYVE